MSIKITSKCSKNVTQNARNVRLDCTGERLVRVGTRNEKGNAQDNLSLRNFPQNCPLNAHIIHITVYKTQRAKFFIECLQHFKLATDMTTYWKRKRMVTGREKRCSHNIPQNKYKIVRKMQIKFPAQFPYRIAHIITSPHNAT